MTAEKAPNKRGTPKKMGRTPKKMGRPRSLTGAKDGTGKIIESHPLFDEMYHMLENNFSAETVVRLLMFQHQEEFQNPSYPPLPSTRSINRWRVDHLPPQMALKGSIVERRLATIDVKVDLFASLQRQFAIAEGRFERAVETEKGLTLLLPGVDKAAETVLKTGDLLRQVGQDLGVYPRVAQLEAMREMFSGSHASAQAIVFQINGDTKTVQQMTDEELASARTAIIEGDVGG